MTYKIKRQKRLNYPSIFFTLMFVLMILAVPALADDQVIFQADMHNLLAQGFDSTLHQIEVVGDFNNWQAGPILKPDASDPYLFTAVNVVPGNEGDIIRWKFRARQTNLYENDGWELGDNRELTLQLGFQLLEPITPQIYFLLDVEPISQVKFDSDGDFVLDRLGEIVKIEGIVISPSYTMTTNYYVQDETASICVYHSSRMDFNLGDKVVVIGKVAQYNGLSELIDPWIFNIGSEPAPEPSVIPISNMGEEWKAGFYRLKT